SSTDQISTISQRSETVDPVLEKLKSLSITSPILTTPPADGSLTDILVRRPSSSSSQGGPQEKAQTICKKQVCHPLDKFCELENNCCSRMGGLVLLWEDIEYKIEVADALATSPKFKPLIHTLQVELRELKERLTEVLSNYEALCNRIAAEGPEPLRSIEPFAVSTSNSTSLSSGKVNL
ncbi:hypothetical protein Goklo_008012, partial [Gossypium klotzschianum]|nr:hypothetical protein [Gossypium klotzschianum]